jgi:hypothetical protein
MTKRLFNALVRFRLYGPRWLPVKVRKLPLVFISRGLALALLMTSPRR